MKVDTPLLQIPFEAMVDSIDKKVVDLTSAFDLLEITEFKSILAHSDKFIPDAKSFLLNVSKNEQQKRIVIFSMQSLDKDLYFDFLSYCTTLYCDGKITENVIVNVIFPGNEWNNRIVLNFYSSKVRKALKKIQNKNATSENLKTVIKQTLSGKLWLMELIR